MSTLYVNNIQPVSGSNLTLISASLVTVDELTVSGITGSLFGTASFATSASYAVSASYEINYETSSSYADYAVTASYALNSTPPGGSDGQVQFNSGSAFGADSNLYWDNTNKRLGVGTSSPSRTLDVNASQAVLKVNSTTTTNSAGILATNSSTGRDFWFGRDSSVGNGFGMSSPAYAGVINARGAYPLYIGANDLNTLSLLADGKVGINQTSPTARLHIKGSGATSATTSLLVQNSSGTNILTVKDGGSDKQVLMNSAVIGSLDISNSIVQVGSGINLIFRSANGAAFNSDYSSANASAQLDVSSTTKGFLPPRMTTTQKNAISTPAAGLEVYDTELSGSQYYDGSSWRNVIAGDNTNLVWDNTNKRLGVGTATPTCDLHVYKSVLPEIRIQNSLGVGLWTKDGHKVLFGSNSVQWNSYHLQTSRSTFGSTDDLGARVGIKGSGNTSSTTALLVQNSDATELFKVTDDGVMYSGTIRATGNLNLGAGNATRYLVTSGQIHPLGNQEFGRGDNLAYLWSNSFFSGYMHITNGTASDGFYNSTAKLQVDSTTKGFLPPRMSDTQRDAISSPAEGLQVYNTSSKSLDVYDGTVWNRFGSSSYISGSLGIRTSSPSKAIETLGGFSFTGQDTSVYVQEFASRLRLSASTSIQMTQNVVIAQMGSIDPSAALHIRGTGATSATTSLLVQNSSGTQLFKVSDDGLSTMQRLNLSNNGSSLLISGIDTLDRGDGIRYGYAGGSHIHRFYTNSGTERLTILNNGQVSVGNNSPNATAILQADSTTQGFLPPRMTETQKNAISSPAVGLMVYQTDATEGLYVYKSTGWTFVA